MSEQKKRKIQPIQEQPFGDILHSMDSFFNNAVKQLQSPRTIPVYQYETKSEYVIEAELPGIRKDQILLDVFQNYIKIGIRDEEFSEEKNDLKQTTQQTVRYQRSDRIISLPFSINESDISAKLSKGLLVIRIPNNRKRISIDTEEV